MTVTRGTSNTNVRGSAEARRARKQYLLEVYAADVDIVSQEEWIDLYEAVFDETDHLGDGGFYLWVDTAPEYGSVSVRQGLGRPACRCYRCGRLLTYETMEVDRIKPGCLGGTYARGNIRPACADCNKKTGAQAQKQAKARREQRRAAERARRARPFEGTHALSS